MFHYILTFRLYLRNRKMLQNWKVWNGDWWGFWPIESNGYILSKDFHISQNHYFPHYYVYNSQDTDEDFKSMIGLVSGLVNGLIIVTQLQWTQFVKDCPANTTTITSLISLWWMGFISVSGLPTLEVIEMKWKLQPWKSYHVLKDHSKGWMDSQMTLIGFLFWWD